MKKTELKQRAQEELLSALSLAWERISDDTSLSEEDKEDLRIEASKQMARIEKMFGYEPYSFIRGA